MTNTDDTTSATYRTITKFLENDDHAGLYGYTAQMLRMIVAHPEREALRQQALDILRAEDDHNDKAAAERDAAILSTDWKER